MPGAQKGSGKTPPSACPVPCMPRCCAHAATCPSCCLGKYAHTRCTYKHAHTHSCARTSAQAGRPLSLSSWGVELNLTSWLVSRPHCSSLPGSELTHGPEAGCCRTAPTAPVQAGHLASLRDSGTHRASGIWLLRVTQRAEGKATRVQNGPWGGVPARGPTWAELGLRHFPLLLLLNLKGPRRSRPQCLGGGQPKRESPVCPCSPPPNLPRPESSR